MRRAVDKPAKELVGRVLHDTERLAKIMIPKATGRTARKFGSAVTVTSGVGVLGQLWNDSVVGWWLHEGTKPHHEPKTRPGPMHFFWERKGEWVTFKSVHHPGIKPVRYLTDPLKLVGKRNGFKVTITLSSR